MKTLCFSLSLLLLMSYCCDAGPNAMSSTGPEKCCFKFFTKPFPPNRVLDITRTHGACEHQAFIVQTVRHMQICYRASFKWAQDLFNSQRNPEGSAQSP